MKRINLIESYIKYILKNNDVKKYQNSSKYLFYHYLKYWAPRKTFYFVLSEKEIKKRVKMALGITARIENNFNTFNVNLDKIDIIFFVGKNTSNGHSFLWKNRAIVWIPLETYKNKLQLEIFITHEIIHAIHYLKNKDFYFSNEKQKNSISRQLITEGIATFLTSAIMGVDDRKSLWADYITKNDYKKWINNCNKFRKNISKLAIKNFNSNTDNIGIFYFKTLNDIYNNRSGYFLGLEIIKWFCAKNNINFLKIIKVPKRILEKEALIYLKNNL